MNHTGPFITSAVIVVLGFGTLLWRTGERNEPPAMSASTQQVALTAPTPTSSAPRLPDMETITAPHAAETCIEPSLPADCDIAKVAATAADPQNIKAADCIFYKHEQEVQAARKLGRMGPPPPSIPMPC
jgi:hypothetical protein